MSKIVVPTVPRPDGNIETSGNPCREYDFVINNYSEEEIVMLCQTIPKIAKQARIAKEIGKSRTPHLQCCIKILKKERYSTLQNKYKCFKRASFRPARNWEALTEYCDGIENGEPKKGYIETIFNFGFPTPIKILANLYDWQRNIETLCMGEPDPRKIHWYWEPLGNVGKSAFVKYMVVKHRALFCDGGKKSDIINLVFNNDMDSCRIVIWDIPRASLGNISYTSLEAIKNGLVCNTKYETGTKVFNPPHIIVFANSPPLEKDKLSADRWNIHQI